MSRRREGFTCFVFGFSAVVLWMAMLRFAPNFFWISPVIPWTLVIATIAASLWLETRLAIPRIVSDETQDAQQEHELVATV